MRRFRMRRMRWTHWTQGMIAALLVAMGLGLGLAGCSPAAEEPADTRVIIDGTGREVTLPATVETIVPLGNTPRMVVYLGLAEAVVGIEACEIADNPLQAYAYGQPWDQLPICGNSALGEVSYYPEEIILANPDVILCTDPADSADQLQQQTGIPVVAVPQGTLFGADYEQALRILGEVCGVSDRAEALIAYLNDTLADLTRRVEGIPEADKPTVLAAAASFKGGHSIDGIYADYPVFDLLAARDVAAEVAKETTASGVMVDREQILAWDPEIIFFDAGNLALVQADYAENPGYFDQLQAVRNGALYQWPNSTWHWTNVEIPLVTAYAVGSLLYPEAFADVVLADRAAEIFDMFLGRPDYLSTLEAAGLSFGPVTLGE